MSDAEVLRETRNHVAFLTLNRPGALNALSLGMVRALRALLVDCAKDADVRAVVLRGAGDKAFCAGGDMRALYQSYQDGASLHHEFFIAEYTLDFQLYAYPKPFVAVLDGITMGGGMGLVQGSTLRVVGERTRIAMPEVGIGLFPDVGASWFLARVPGALGTYLALTGTQIRGADAVYCRLADVFLPPAAIESLPDDIAAMPWSGDAAADLRSLIHARTAHGLPAPALSVLRPAIDLHFSRDTVPEVLHSLEAESRPEFADWARQTAALMRSRSPTMLAVTLRQLQLGKSLDLADCFRMELSLMEHCFEHGDLIEGVRALLIDKDKSPRWRPADIDAVTKEAVDEFFSERWRGRSHPLKDLERTSFYE